MNYRYYLFTLPPSLAIGFAFYYFGKSPQWFIPFFTGCIFTGYVALLHRKYKE